MNFLSDPYSGYVLAAYGATALILGALVWATVRANRRAREALDDMDPRRGEARRPNGAKE